MLGGECIVLGSKHVAYGACRQSYLYFDFLLLLNVVTILGQLFQQLFNVALVVLVLLRYKLQLLLNFAPSVFEGNLICRQRFLGRLRWDGLLLRLAKIELLLGELKFCAKLFDLHLAFSQLLFGMKRLRLLLHVESQLVVELRVYGLQVLQHRFELSVLVL